MRAAFSAITRPTPISQIVSTYSFNERLFYASLDEIKNEPRFAGVIDRGTYVPHIYSYTRKKWIESFLSQNGFIEYNKLSKINIPEPRKYLLVNFPEGLPLETCFVASSVIQQVDASVSDALANNAWLDPLVEFQLSAKDAMVLLKSCPSFIAASQEKKESPVILDDHYLVSRGLLERCVASLKDKVTTETPKKAPLIIQALGKHIPASKPAAADEEGGKGGKGGKAAASGGGGKGGRGGNQKGKRRGKGRDDDEDEEEEEEKVVERPSARGRNAAAAAASAKSRAAGGVQQEVLTEAEVRACLKQWYEEAEADFLDVIYQQIRPIVRELNKAAVESIQQNASSGKKKDHKALEQQFSVLYQNIQLFLRSAEEVTDSAVSEALRRHLLATLCTEATNLLVYMMALHHGVSMEAEKITTANERKEVIAQLPLTAATPLAALGDSLRGSGVEEFLKQLESLSEEAQLHLKPLDKKKQRLLTHTHKLDFLEQLKEVTEPPLAFHLAAVVLYAQVFNLALHIPGRSVPALLAQMADHLPADLVEELTQLSELLKKGEPIEAERVEGLKAKVVEFASVKKEREK
ncbi:uncharacterized protein ACA1_359590 [Acanthamoeba castellanii str. Neff]|uniref:Uncharacterized protein n=1 Tax=Acanthamoeba castellanii (strain ATCC 30010 / Neff) TaxID=1257118 RepID=L8GTA3_ACACF|nr:uncharacterized protein ACA1_359590 [Acanthamoeba castellanii str. Neff]ELR16424.1 hypothetical protein ACA1_359590 [Acanthamoeba castellanii str. Neff]